MRDISYLWIERYDIIKMSLFLANQTTESVQSESNSCEVFHGHDGVILKLTRERKLSRINKPLLKNENKERPCPIRLQNL